jgi:hypothetical protein
MSQGYLRMDERAAATIDACDMPSCDMTPWPDILVQAYFFFFQVDTCCNYLQNYSEHAFQIVVVKWDPQKKCIANSCESSDFSQEKVGNHYFEALLLELVKNWSTLILPFWYFCFLLAHKARLALCAKRKQKYQNGNIHRKRKVLT